ncbi:hypothetical protein CL614_09140 [archaeon]|nr:hypothetical protein [archaeon]
MEYFLDNLQNYEGKVGGYHSSESPTEDGNHTVALHIFDSISIEHDYVLDIGAFSTRSSNVVPIMAKYGLHGLLLDGKNSYNDPRITKVWLEKDTICNILRDNKCPKKLDYISLDVDNMDYWFLEAILNEGYESNLLIIEFNPIWSADEAFVKKYYRDAYKSDELTGASSNYGASLRAFMMLLSQFDYRLIHVIQKCLEPAQLTSNNAFFIKSKFDYLDKFKDQEEVIKKCLPVPFVEGTKMKKNINLFNSSCIEEIKVILKNKFFVEIEGHLSFNMPYPKEKRKEANCDKIIADIMSEYDDE